MRLLLLALAIALSGAAASGCDEDTRVPCEEAYDHLSEISKRRPNAKLREAFVAACMGAFDRERHECLMAAKTPEEAMECRPGKTRPG